VHESRGARGWGKEQSSYTEMHGAMNREREGRRAVRVQLWRQRKVWEDSLGTRKGGETERKDGEDG